MGPAPGTVRRVHGVLHAALAQAQRWEWIWINPAAYASPPRAVPNEIRPPSPADVALLIAKATASDPSFGTYLRLAASTGARRSQVLALRWKDIDLLEGRVSFTRALVEGPHGPVLAPTKTRRAYQVSLDTETAMILAAGVAIPIVAARLSHARASTTLNVYAHAVPGGDRDAAEQLSALLRDAHRPEHRSETRPGAERESETRRSRPPVAFDGLAGLRVPETPEPFSMSRRATRIVSMVVERPQR